MRAVAYGMLGSSAEAEEAVREALAAREARRLSGAEGTGTGTGSDTDSVADSDAGEMTAAVARACLARLRSRESRREDPWDPWDPRTAGEPGSPRRSEEAALETLPPSERVAFVLHEMFAAPVEGIAPIVDRTPAATRQLVSRARTRVRGTEEMPEPDLPRQREVVAALLAAARGGDPDTLRALLDPDVLLRADAEAARSGATTAHGARAVAESLAERARTARMALMDGAACLVDAPDGPEGGPEGGPGGGPGGGPRAVIAFTVIEGRVTAADILMDPSHLGRLGLRAPAQ
ncbi:RNA polymerase subunit sigma-70 [Streptomyces sp. Je 1-79]|uniref:sigma factor-like helix-turn-helix DNA-binding protein n=1 Tax=Streptomyces sp. Je 1-79 TaxID=2943847 RepID=UPI0021A801D9|nr:sigma factor-like helix-turn-helix DNA-binding protein [Streptomyces sp. Je 1-79]MCT4354573.1 RNA polymerase subunit sigma-70 [Streptomyces sp. Je 1-79]